MAPRHWTYVLVAVVSVLSRCGSDHVQYKYLENNVDLYDSLGGPLDYDEYGNRLTRQQYVGPQRPLTIQDLALPPTKQYSPQYTPQYTPQYAPQQRPSWYFEPYSSQQGQYPSGGAAQYDGYDGYSPQVDFSARERASSRYIGCYYLALRTRRWDTFYQCYDASSPVYTAGAVKYRGTQQQPAAYYAAPAPRRRPAQRRLAKLQAESKPQIMTLESYLHYDYTGGLPGDDLLYSDYDYMLPSSTSQDSKLTAVNSKKERHFYRHPGTMEPRFSQNSVYNTRGMK